MSVKLIAAKSLFAALIVASGAVQAQEVTVHFDQTEVPTVANLDSVTTLWASYGLTISNAYWYTDAADTFDMQGIATQSAGPGRIDIAGFADSLSLDFVTLAGHDYHGAIYDAAHNLLDSFLVDAADYDQNLSYSFEVAGIASFEWHNASGFVAVSTLSYAPAAAVPEPQTYALMLAGLAMVGALARRRRAAR